MMKKLLVLSLVLAVSAMSSAALSISYADGAVSVSEDASVVGGIDLVLGIINVDGTKDTKVTAGGIVVRDSSAPSGTINVDLYDGATIGDDWGSELARFTGGAINAYWSDPDPALVLDDGFWFSMPLGGYKVTTEALAEIIVQLASPLTGVSVGAPIYLEVIPEPMTMGLLGLGALFLRKRK
jgi:hypothetical protein